MGKRKGRGSKTSSTDFKRKIQAPAKKGQPKRKKLSHGNSSIRIGKNIADGDGQIKSSGSGNTTIIKYKGSLKDGTDLAVNQVSEHGNIDDHGDNNKNEIEVEETNARVSAASPRSQAVTDQERGSDAAQTSGEKNSGSEALLTVRIKSLAKREVINHRCKKADLVSVVKAAAKKKLNESGEFYLFKDGRKLNENKTMAENGIKTNDKITAGVEEMVQSGRAGRKVKA